MCEGSPPYRIIHFPFSLTKPEIAYRLNNYAYLLGPLLSTSRFFTFRHPLGRHTRIDAIIATYIFKCARPIFFRTLPALGVWSIYAVRFSSLVTVPKYFRLSCSPYVHYDTAINNYQSLMAFSNSLTLSLLISLLPLVTFRLVTYAALLRGSRTPSYMMYFAQFSVICATPLHLTLTASASNTLGI